jgi:hypothetical protein
MSLFLERLQGVALCLIYQSLSRNKVLATRSHDFLALISFVRLWATIPRGVKAVVVIVNNRLGGY